MSTTQTFSTDAAQTAIAVLALIAAGKSTHPATVHGLQYLIDQQKKDGSWSQNFDLQEALQKDTANSVVVEESEPMVFSIAQSVSECVEEAETFLFTSYKKSVNAKKQTRAIEKKKTHILRLYEPNDHDEEFFPKKSGLLPTVHRTTAPALKLYAE